MRVFQVFICLQGLLALFGWLFSHMPVYVSACVSEPDQWRLIFLKALGVCSASNHARCDKFKSRSQCVIRYWPSSIYWLRVCACKFPVHSTQMCCQVWWWHTRVRGRLEGGGPAASLSLSPNQTISAPGLYTPTHTIYTFNKWHLLWQI